jgi:uncharacterized protein YndB with AHSA1/START domain
MKLDVFLEKFYPHPIEKVWAALTDPAALGVWLMATDFEPQVGKRFAFRDTANPAWRGWADCEVVTLEPPSRMVWSWLSTDEGVPTRVEIRLEPVTGGTRLLLTHTGETDPGAVSRLTSGWPRKLADLDHLLMQNRDRS